MKKFLGISFIISMTLLFTGCQALLDLLGSFGKNQKSELITDVKVIPINDYGTPGKEYKINLEDENVLENSKVFVVQINNSGTALDYNDYDSKLHNPVKMEFDGIESNRSADSSFEENLLINEVPAFVREWNKQPLPKLDDVSDVVENSISPARYVDDGPEIGDEREFVIAYRSDDYLIDDGVLKYSSKHANIYYYANISWLIDEETYENKGLDYISDLEFEKLGAKFDKLFEAETNLVGSNEIKVTAKNLIKTPADKKITILVYDIYGDSLSERDTTSGTFGYFWGNDFYIGRANSNEDQIIYIDSVLLKKYPDTAYSTLAHEFNHLLNFVNKEINLKLTYQEATWFTEMLSMVTEDLLFDEYLKERISSENTVIKNRIPYFLGNYNYGFLDWSDSNIYDYYGNTFAYGSFLVRNYGGMKLIKEIATNNKVDKYAITQALNTLGKKSPFDSRYYATFEDTVKDFCLSSLNYKLDSKATNLRTFNKGASENPVGYRYKYSNIYLPDFHPVRNGRYQGSKTGLWKFTDESNVDLGRGGMKIEYAGEGVNEITVTLPDIPGLDMYIVIQNFKQDEKKE